jgi:hypothetical protein
MCATCGCCDEAGTRIGTPDHAHDHDHGHDHDDHGRRSRTVLLEQDVLAKNDLLARRNRAWLCERQVLAVNLMSAPGAGKTTLLERTVRDLGGESPVCVIEGDQETLLDALIPVAETCARGRGQRHDLDARVEGAHVVLEGLQREINVGQQVDLVHRVNICGYFRGLSWPSVTESSTTRCCSPRSNRAGQTRLPTFSTNSNEPASGSSVPSARCSMAASRWHPAPVLICTTGAPAALIRSWLSHHRDRIDTRHSSGGTR